MTVQAQYEGCTKTCQFGEGQLSFSQNRKGAGGDFQVGRRVSQQLKSPIGGGVNGKQNHPQLEGG